MAFHSQYPTLIISQQHTLLPEFLQQRLNLVVLELDDLLLTFVSPANEGGKHNVAGLKHELRPLKTRSWAGKPTRFRGGVREVKRLKWDILRDRNSNAENDLEFG